MIADPVRLKALARTLGDQELMTTALILRGVAMMMQEMHDYARAQAYEECLIQCRAVGEQLLMSVALVGLAQADQGLPTWVALLWGTAEPLRESQSLAIPQTLYDRMVAVARRQLGEAAFTAAWARGRSMTPEQVLAAQATAEMPLSAPTKPPAPPPANTPSTYPSGLTAREVEVLRLVARGLTDAQVAEHLVISPRTVNSHLTSIYSKLRVSSRAAATRYATEHHLL
jgi:DNA-binding CsgD family transcriptional regulator